jgi:hypothetical protein
VDIKKETSCNTCTRRLVVIAYQRAPWFRIVREPMKLAMNVWAKRYGLDFRTCEVNSTSCGNCIRFYKNALKERSTLFRWLHSIINPVFDVILEWIVSSEEVAQAKAHACAAIDGEALPYDGDKYIKNPWWNKIVFKR